jgi:hypothetical protein
MGRLVLGAKTQLLADVWPVMKSSTCGKSAKTLNLGGNSRRNSR